MTVNERGNIEVREWGSVSAATLYRDYMEGKKHSRSGIWGPWVAVPGVTRRLHMGCPSTSPVPWESLPKTEIDSCSERQRYEEPGASLFARPELHTDVRAAVRNGAVDPTGPVLRVPAPTHLSEAMRLPRSSAAFGVDWETGNVVPSSLYASAAAIQPDTLYCVVARVSLGSGLRAGGRPACRGLRKKERVADLGDEALTSQSEGSLLRGDRPQPKAPATVRRLPRGEGFPLARRANLQHQGQLKGGTAYRQVRPTTLDQT